MLVNESEQSPADSRSSDVTYLRPELRFAAGHASRPSGNRSNDDYYGHVWPHRDMCHVLRRAVGLNESLVIEFCSEELQPGDMFLLMSDGIWEVLGEKTVGEILCRDPDPQQAANTLVSESIRYQTKYLGHNDATALVVRVNSCSS